MKKVVIIDKMTGVIQNKYEAVRVVAKEARRINNIILRSENAGIDEKPTTLALKRLLDNRIKYEFSEEVKKDLKDMGFDEEE